MKTREKVYVAICGLKYQYDCTWCRSNCNLDKTLQTTRKTKNCWNHHTRQSVFFNNVSCLRDQSNIKNKCALLTIIKVLHKKMPTASSVPRRSPIQVLTGLNIAWLQWSDENWYVQCDMAVGEKYTKLVSIYWNNYACLFLYVYYVRIATKIYITSKWFS